MNIESRTMPEYLQSKYVKWITFEKTQISLRFHESKY